MPAELIRHLAAQVGASPYHRRAKAALETAPWIWPLEDDPTWEGCARLAGAPPKLLPGDVPLLTVNERQASIWLHRFNLDSHPILRCEAPGRQCLAVVELARAALTRTVRLFWGNEPWQHGDPVVVTHLDTLPEDGQAPLRLGLDGPSVGLSMFLSMASRAYDVSPLPDRIALATVDEHGRVGRVDGLDRKLPALAELAPRIRTVLVWVGQREEAAEVAPQGRFTILPVATVDEAMDQVLEDKDVASRLVDLGKQRRSRSRVVRQLFNQALMGRSEVFHWGPVKAAADLALEKWKKELSAEEVGRLFTVRMVAGRYAKEPAAQDAPSDDWLASLSEHTRAVVLAHLVQQAHDFGEELSPKVAFQVEATLGQVGDSMPAVRLRGARARLWARDGQAQRAMAEQRHLARLSVELLQPRGATHSLAEWLRLAGVLGHGEELAAALVFEDELEDYDGLTPDSRPYVDLAAGRALALLGDVKEAEKRLLRIIDGPVVPGRTLVLAGAWRWLGVCGDRRTEDELERMVGRLTLEDERRAVRTVQVLVRLDQGDLDANAAVAAMEVRWQALGKRVLDMAPEDADREEWLRRRWPY